MTVACALHVCALACSTPSFPFLIPQMKKALEAGTFALREGAVCSVEVGAPLTQHSTAQHERVVGPQHK